MKNIRKNCGITLIALVITVVVLLILAGIVITMISGDNGILTMAEKASDKTKISSTTEALKIEILAKKIEALKNNEELTKNKLTQDETYNIKGLEHVEGLKYNYQGRSLYIDESLEIYNELVDIKDLKVGDIIYYSTKEGSYTANSDITGITEEQVFSIKKNKLECVVFSKSEDGTIRIIPSKCIGTLTLAGSKGFYGVKNALNNICQLYFNEKYATKSVSIGMNDTYIDDAKLLKEIYDMGHNNVMEKYRGGLSEYKGYQIASKASLINKEWEENFTCAWLPSTEYIENNDHFRIRYCQSNTDVVQEVRIWDGTWQIIYIYEMGIVPVISLKSSIEVGEQGGIYKILEND